jgi:hypothetical protein
MVPPDQRPADGRSTPAAPAAPLPAPYRSPWRALLQDLRDAAADLGLRRRELLRRNGEGSLWRPPWWPADLAPLFWPLAVIAALSALIAALGLLAPLPWRQPSTADAPPSAAVGRPLERVDADAAPPSASAAPAAASAVAEAVEPPQTAAEATPDPPLTPAVPTLPSAAPVDEEPPPPEPVPDPLALWLERPEVAGLIAQADPEIGRGTLVLRLRPAFSDLTPADRERRAEQWRGQVGELGYDHLELRDAGGHLLARDALVGSGMIVFTEHAQP